MDKQAQPNGKDLNLSWRVPGFTESRTLGSGIQGRVVLASEEAAHDVPHVVAIKYLHPHQRRDQAKLNIFRNEARVLSQVANPHISRLHEYIETPEGAAIIMEAVNGRPLRAVLDERVEPFRPEVALVVLKGSLLGLGAAHAVGVVHRDFKPANIIVDETGASKLIDFGIAVLSGAGDRSGTPVYMAPEQWEGTSSTPATDIYAATCVFFECITGGPPFSATSAQALMTQHMVAPIPCEAVPEALRPLLLRGLAKNPGQRIWDANAFVAELEAIAVAEYGTNWERRGLAGLGAAAAVLASTFPLTVLGLTTAQGAGMTGSLTGHGIGAGVKGIAAKLGGSKTVLAAGGLTVATAVAVLFWPTTPSVGGVSSGSYRVSAQRPAVLLSNPTLPDGDLASPWGEWSMTVSPQRATAGTRVRVTIRERARTPWGIEYTRAGRLLCHDPNSERQDAHHQPYFVGLGPPNQAKTPDGRGMLWLYRTPANQRHELPKNSGIRIAGNRVRTNSNKKYEYHDCSWHFDSTFVTEFRVPEPEKLKPGSYLVSGVESPGALRAKAVVSGKLTDIPPDTAGVEAVGSLPRLTVLEE